MDSPTLTPIAGPDDRDRLIASLLDLLPDFFYVHTYQLRYVYANKSAADYFRTTKEGMVGKRIEEVDADLQQARFFTDLCQSIMDVGEPRITDAIPYTRFDGTPGYLRQHDIPFRHPVTNELMLMGMSRDVTNDIELLRQRERMAGMQREMQIAQQIQRSLLPAPLASESGVSVSGRSTPAAYTGGDFYDWMRLDDGSLIVSIGDVTGHGVGPALLAAECRAYWRVLAPTLPLRDAVIRLSALLQPSLNDGRFVTYAAARVMPDGRCTLFSAGHGPILLRRATGEVESLPSHELPLGLIDPDTLSDTSEFTLDVGDALVLISDGVIELRNISSQEYGTERLIDSLERHADLSCERLVDAIDQDNIRFSGEGLATDDRSIVIVTRQIC